MTPGDQVWAFGQTATLVSLDQHRLLCTITVGTLTLVGVPQQFVEEATTGQWVDEDGDHLRVAKWSNSLPGADVETSAAGIYLDPDACVEVATLLLRLAGSRSTPPEVAPSSTEPLDLGRAQAWATPCGSCDYGLPYTCICVEGDPRVVISGLLAEIERLRAGEGRAHE